MFGIGRHWVARWAGGLAGQRSPDELQLVASAALSIPARELAGCVQGSAAQEDITTPLQLQITAPNCHFLLFPHCG